MKNKFTLLVLAFSLLSSVVHAGQQIVKTMALDSTITTSGIVRLVVNLTDDAIGPDIGITLHQNTPASPWDDAMAIMMFDFTKNTNGGIHLAGFDNGTWDWQEKVKVVEKQRQIALWLSVDVENHTHALSAQLQGESGVTEVYTGYGDRASINSKPHASVGYCSVFVNNRDGQPTSAIQIVEEATVVDQIEPYQFSDTNTCFTTYSELIPVSIDEGDSYAFAGKDLTTAGIYYDTTRNAQGCDSIIAINLTLVPNSEKAIILAQLQQVNQYYMAQNPETETVNSGASKWLEGSYFNGHMALFQLHPTRENMRYAVQWGKNNNWNIGNTRGEADNQCVGQVYMDLYYANGAKNDAWLAKVGTSVDDMVNRSSAISDWDWIDALYMAMPTLTRYGNYTGNAAYFDKLYAMYNSTKVTQKLYNANDSLWYRDGAVLSGKKYRCYWARGNGWVFGAHVRTLMYLPINDAHRQEYIDTYVAMAKKLKGLQREDGFWNACLDDDTYYPGPETSGTAFFVYGMAWGINHGILDKDEFLPTVMKGWNGLVGKALDTNGRIGYVQGVADEPKDDQPVTFAKSREYGYGNFLLAGCEVIQLVEGEMPIPEHFYVKNVEVLEQGKVRVNFFEPADKATAETISNYTLTDGAELTQATLAQDGLSCELQLANLKKGPYGIAFNAIKSVSGKSIEAASGQYFLYEYAQTSSNIAEQSAALELSVFPNPTQGEKLYVMLNNPSDGQVCISLCNLSGQLIVSQRVEQAILGEYFVLPTEDMPKGVYILTVASHSATATQKVIIQ